MSVQAAPGGVNDQSEAVSYAEFFIDDSQVIAHCAFADAHVVGDLLVLEALGDEADDLALPFGQ